MAEDFDVKDWRNRPDTSTPINATSLEDMETRLAAYAKTQIESLEETVARKSQVPVDVASEGVAVDGSDVTSDLLAMLADTAVRKRGIKVSGADSVLGISAPLPLTTPLFFDRFATLQAVDAFEGPMIDLSRSGTGTIATQRLMIEGHPIIDANHQEGVYCIGSEDGIGNPNAHFGPMTLTGTEPGVYAISADQSGSNVGALVGTNWEYIQFEDCAQWMNFGLVADDIIVQNFRGNMLASNKPTGPVLRLLGTNITLAKGFIHLGESDMNSSGRCVLAQIGSNPVDIGRIFLEAAVNDVNFTHLFWPINPSCDLQIERCLIGFGAAWPELRAFAYLDLNASDNRLRRSLSLKSITRAATGASSWVLDSDVAAGQTTIPIHNEDVVADGTQVIVDSGTAIEEVVTIANAAVSPPTCSAFVYPHASGAKAEQHMGLVEIRHNNGAGAAGARIGLHVEDCDEFRLGVTDTGNEGFSSDSSADLAPAVHLTGRRRRQRVDGLASPAGGLNGTLIPADRSVDFKREHARRLLRPTNALYENYDRSDCGSNATLVSGTLHLTEGGVLHPDDPVPTALEFASGTSTSGASMTQTSFYIVRRSDRAVLARSEADATTSWSAAGIARRLNLDPVARGTGNTTNGSKTIANVSRSDRYLWRKGDAITGTGIPANTKVIDVDLTSASTGTIKISNAATADGTGITLNAAGVRPSSLTPIYLGVLVIGTTPPTLTARGAIRGLLFDTPTIAGNSTSGLSDRLAVGATVDAPTDGSGGVNPAWAALY